MSSQYVAQPATVESNLPAAVNIASTTNATPIVITTAAPHGIKTGEYFAVFNADEPNLFGAHLVAGAVTSTTIEALVAPAGTNTVGTLAGGANGTVQNLGFGTTFQIPSDGPGNPRSAASINVAFEALGDRTAWLQYAKGNLYSGNVWTGTNTFNNTSTFKDTIVFYTGSLTTVQAAATFSVLGAQTVGGTLTVTTGGALTVNSGGTLTCDAGSTMTSASATGLRLTGTQPAATADPGANNIAIATNQSKAWGNVSIGNNLATINDGMNIASAVIDASNNFVLITFARAMANANYAVTFGVEYSGAVAAVDFPVANNKTTTTFELWNFDGCGANAGGTAATRYSMASGHVGVISFQVLGRQ